MHWKEREGSSGWALRDRRPGRFLNDTPLALDPKALSNLSYNKGMKISRGNCSPVKHLRFNFDEKLIKTIKCSSYGPKAALWRFIRTTRVKKIAQWYVEGYLS